MNNIGSMWWNSVFWLFQYTFSEMHADTSQSSQGVKDVWLRESRGFYSPRFSAQWPFDREAATIERSISIAGVNQSRPETTPKTNEK